MSGDGALRRRVANLLIVATILVALACGVSMASSSARTPTRRAISSRPRSAHTARPVAQSPPTLSGPAQSGAQLTASPGTWSPTPTSYAYKWTRCNAAGARCKKVRGANSSTYLLTGRDVGSRLRVSVVAFAQGHRSRPASSTLSEVVAGGPGGPISHLEYVLNDGAAHVYSIDGGFGEVESFPIPEGTRGVRGVEVCAAKATMYFAVGGDGGTNGTGAVVAYDLISRKTLWQRSYSTGIDSMAISLDCSKLYMPVGELASTGEWKILSTVNGSEQGAIQTPGTGPHDGVLSADGKILLLGDRNYNHLAVYNTGTGKPQEQVGPLQGGVRPLTIDGADTLSFTTATGFTGFQVGSLAGSVLWTENFGGTCAFSTCSHGISITPDSKEVAVIDAAHKAVQFWNVESARSGKAPTHVATVPVAGLSGEASGCAYDCGRSGWVQHSHDGRYVFVGDSGDVIATATHKVVAHIASMENTRETIEVDWENGAPVATSERTGVGRTG